MVEVIKVILALIGIALLIYLMTSLYGFATQKTKVEQAKASLDEINHGLSYVWDNSNVNEREVPIYSPLGWYFRFYNTYDWCICPDDDMSYNSCKKEGACKVIEFNIDNLRGSAIKIEKKDSDSFKTLKIEKKEEKGEIVMYYTFV